MSDKDSKQSKGMFDPHGEMQFAILLEGLFLSGGPPHASCIMHLPQLTDLHLPPNLTVIKSKFANVGHPRQEEKNHSKELHLRESNQATSCSYSIKSRLLAYNMNRPPRPELLRSRAAIGKNWLQWCTDSSTNRWTIPVFSLNAAIIQATIYS